MGVVGFGGDAGTLLTSFDYGETRASGVSLGMGGLLREILCTVLFILGVLVLPELLRINGVENRLTRSLVTWIALIPIFYTQIEGPLYGGGNTSSSRGPTLSPEVFYAVRWGNSVEFDRGQTTQLIGPLLGGVLAGKIMERYFPD